MRGIVYVLICVMCAAPQIGCRSPAGPAQPRPADAPAAAAAPIAAPAARAPGQSGAFASKVASNEGYTALQPSADTRIVYVSSSQGRDGNSGLSQAQPKATLEAGLALLRDQHPDWLMLKRGDVWDAARGFMIDKSGRSRSEMLLVSAYGAGPRPEIRGTVRLGTGYRATSGLHHVALTSVHVHLAYRDPKSASFNPSGDPIGLYIGEGGESRAPIAIEDVLVEDVLVNFGGVIVQANLADSGEYRVHDVRLRRLVVKDAYQDARASGMYFHGIDGLLVEECAIDNVQQRQVPSAEPTWEDHSIYLQVTNRNAIVRGSLFTRVPDGPMMRAGGVFEDNVVVRAQSAHLQGYIHGGAEPVSGGVSSRVVGNAFLEIGGPGLTLGNIARGEVSGNLLIKPATRDRAAIELQAAASTPDGMQRANAGVHNLEIRGNTVHGYRTALGILRGGPLSKLRIVDNVFSAPGEDGMMIASVMPLGRDVARFAGNAYHSGARAGWFSVEEGSAGPDEWPAQSGETGARFAPIEFVDPSRDVASYNASLGGEASLEAFVREVHAQTKGNYRPAYTAAALLGYLRAGYARR